MRVKKKEAQEVNASMKTCTNEKSANFPGHRKSKFCVAAEKKKNDVWLVKMQEHDSHAVFWAEKIAGDIRARKKFRFVDAEIPEIKNPVVKSSSSLSGVLHIGRLSDIIRGEAVYRALKENNPRAGFIYVTEDMDPLRKVPAGVPKHFSDYIGVPVSDVPDPEGCHESYAMHFKQEFLETFSKFLVEVPTVFSMREEYKKGNFTPFIIELVRNSEKVKGIINKFRDSPVDPKWSPWKPICDKCGKLQTTVITGVDSKKIEYVCSGYEFESEKAAGCGYEGASDLRKANGKLVWKSEWACQWKRWGVVCEGAGKEYNAPNSAWFVNAEICERVLNFPMPEPVFYEHLMIDGRKMSASVGNVVYPHEWLEVGRPEAIKLLYMKRLLKTRNFSWADLPLLESELDKAAQVAFKGNPEGKDEVQAKKLFDYSAVKGRKTLPMKIDYSLCAYLSSFFSDGNAFLENLVQSGQLPQKISAEEKSQLLERFEMAGKWVKKHGPEDYKLFFLEKTTLDLISSVPREAIPAVKQIAAGLPSMNSVEAVQDLVFTSAKKTGAQPKIVFQALYLLLIGRPSGPKIGTLVFAFGKEKVVERLKEV